MPPLCLLMTISFLCRYCRTLPRLDDEFSRVAAAAAAVDASNARGISLAEKAGEITTVAF